MKLITLLFLCFLVHSALSQHIITGTVINPDDSSSVPGVDVIEDSLNQTISDLHGNFSITVKELPTRLTFSSVGMLTRNITVSSDSILTVYLQNYVLAHYFDSQKVGVYLQSGLINNPLGGKLYLSSPYFLNSRLVKSSIGYQTNVDDNTLLDGFLSLDNIFSYPYFSAGLSLAYQDVTLGKFYHLTNKSVEIDLWHRYSPVDLSLGYANLDISDAEKAENYHSIVIKVSRYFYKLFALEASSKIWLYNDLQGFNVQLERSFHRLHTFASYQQLDSYAEFTIGLGYLTTYIFSDPNKY
ncbi:carboxypeptidase-like regulatory domain-containing protein [Catalinimonas sp. 4WD22]|uniref:carboxypeptidase-like regulatory domain-containing protein n=1 Tax=Catalinimonas locisalis TaxID=3133978 RepID=UPI00310124EC